MLSAWPPWVILLLLVLLMAAGRWFALDPALVNPFIGAAIVLLVLVHAHPELAGHTIIARILATAGGAAVALVVLFLPLDRPAHPVPGP